MAKFLKNHGKILIALFLVLFLASVFVLILRTTGNAQMVVPASVQENLLYAKQLLDGQQYELATLQYKMIAKAYPRTKEALQAWQGLAIIAIRSQEDTKVNIIIGQITQDYADQPELATVLFDLGNEYWNQQRFDRAQQIYGMVRSLTPDSTESIWATVWSYSSEIHQNVWIDAPSAINDLSGHYSVHSRLSEAIFLLGQEWYKAKYYEQAQIAYQYVEDNFSASDQAIWSCLWGICCDVHRKIPIDARAEVDRMISIYGSHACIDEALFRLGTELWHWGFYEQADLCYQTILDQYPDGKFDLSARLGICKSVIRLQSPLESAVAEQFLAVTVADELTYRSALEELAREYHNYHYEQQAVETYQILIEQYPQAGDATEAQKALITCLGRTKGNVDFDSVLNDLRYAPEDSSTVAADLYEAAKVLWRNGRFLDSQRIYRHIALEMGENDYQQLGLIWDIGADIQMGHSATAEEKMKFLLADCCSNISAKASLASLADILMQKDFNKGVELYETIVNSFPQEDLLAEKHRLAMGYIRQGRREEAWSLIDALPTENSTDVGIYNIWLDLSKVFQEEKNYEDALILAGRIAESQADMSLKQQALTHIGICDIYLRKTTDADAILNQFQLKLKEKADLSSVFTLANYFWQNGCYEESQKLYQYVMDNTGEGEEYFWSQVWRVGADIRLKRSVSPQAVIDGLETCCADWPRLPEALCLLGDEYIAAGQINEAKSLFQYVLDGWPKDNYTLAAERRLLTAKLRQGEVFNAEKIISLLEMNYADHPERAETFYVAACAARDNGQEETAQRLWSYIITAWRNHIDADSQKYCGLSALQVADMEAFNRIVDVLLSTTSEQRDTRVELMILLNACMEVGRYDDIIALGQRMLESPDGCFNGGELKYILGLSSMNKGDNPTAARYFEEVYEENIGRDRHLCPRIPLKLGHIYRGMGDYNKAVFWLQKQHEFTNETLLEQALLLESTIQRVEQKDASAAAKTLGTYTQLFPDSARLPVVLYNLALCYQQEGNADGAKMVIEAALAKDNEKQYTDELSHLLKSIKIEGAGS